MAYEVIDLEQDNTERRLYDPSDLFVPLFPCRSAHWPASVATSSIGFPTHTLIPLLSFSGRTR